MEADTILSIEIQNYYLNKATKIWAFIICIIATALFSCLAALTQWGYDLGFEPAELLLYRSSIQLLFAIIYTMLLYLYSRCCCCVSDNEELDKQQQNENYKHQNGIKKLSVSSQESLSSFSGDTRQTYGIFAIKQIFSSINNGSLINYSDTNEFIEPETVKQTLTYSQINNMTINSTNNNNNCLNYTFYEWTLIVMRGLFGALNNASIIYAICLLDLGDAISLTCLSPLFVLLFIYIFFNENDFVINNPMTTIRFFIAIIVCLVGIVLIIQPKFIGQLDGQLEADDTNGWIWGISGSVMSASIYVTLKKGYDKSNININHWFYSYCIISSILGIISSYSHVNTLYGDIDPTKHKYHLLLLILIGFVSFCAQFLFSISLQFLTPKYAIFCTQILFIIFGYFWQIFVFKNMPKFITIIGALFVTIGVILIYVDFHYKILNIIQVKQNELNKSKLIEDRMINTAKEIKKRKQRSKKKKFIKNGNSDSNRSSGDGVSANLPSMLSNQTDSNLTFNMDI